MLTKNQVSPRTQRTLSLAAATFLAFSVSGCGAADGSSVEPEGRLSQALFGGVLDNDANANDAVVALRIGDGSPFELCTGALVAPNVVLTARHCVSENISEDINCDEHGESDDGDQVGADVAPHKIHVLLGASPDFSATPAANGRAIFRPTGQTICNTDIAIVVLDRPINDVQPMRIRLSAPVRQGETIRAVGYGQNDQNVRLGTRFRKDGVPILAAGPVPRDGSTGRPAIAEAEFEVGRSICQGDSGGPAISEATGAIVGIVSRGVECNYDFGHIYTRTAGFRRLFDAAFAEAGATPLEEESANVDLTSASGGSANPSNANASARVNASLQDDSTHGGCSVAAGSRGGPEETGERMAGISAAMALAGVFRRNARRRRAA